MAASKSRGSSNNTTVENKASAPWDMVIAERLGRTQVYKSLPGHIRGRVDEAILLRPEECSSLEAIDKRFGLEENYGITMKALRGYARKLEQLARPAAASHLLTRVLGCLPEKDRQRMLAGSEVLLLSRVIQALSDGKAEALGVADLAKLASVLSSFAKSGDKSSASAENNCRRPDASKSNENDTAIPPSSEKLAETVRFLYGLNWPPCNHEGKS